MPCVRAHWYIFGIFFLRNCKGMKIEFDFMILLAPFWKRDHPNNDNNARSVRKWIIKNIPQLFYNNSLFLRTYTEFIWVIVTLFVDLIENLKYRVSHSKPGKVILLWREYRFWFLLIFWVLRVYEKRILMPDLSVFYRIDVELPLQNDM